MPSDSRKDRPGAEVSETPPLTTEQISFAKVLGEALAQHWQVQHVSHRTITPPPSLAIGDTDAPCPPDGPNPSAS